MPKIAEYSDFEIYQCKQAIKSNYGNIAEDWFMILMMKIAKGETVKEEMYDANFIQHIDRLQKN